MQCKICAFKIRKNLYIALAIACQKDMMARVNFIHAVDSTHVWTWQYMIAHVSGQGLASGTVHHDHSIISFQY